MLCVKCGKEMEHDAMFCSVCGVPLRSDAVTAATIKFVPKKTLGQWMLRKASIEVHGETKTTKIRKPIDFQVQAGEVKLCCYCNYLGKMGTVTKQMKLESGKKYEITYHAPMIIFLKGKMEIKELV